jgi:hypothetical protein
MNQIAQPLALVGSPAGVSPREPLRRKPRAIAISPAPNRSCYTAGIHHLLESKRSVTGGLNQIAQPLALVGSPIGDLPCEPLRRKPRAIAISPAPNRSCYTAGIRHLLEPDAASQGGGFEQNAGTVHAFFHRQFVEVANLMVEPLLTGRYPRCRHKGVGRSSRSVGGSFRHFKADR